MCLFLLKYFGIRTTYVQPSEKTKHTEDRSRMYEETINDNFCLSIFMCCVSSCVYVLYGRFCSFRMKIILEKYNSKPDSIVHIYSIWKIDKMSTETCILFLYILTRIYMKVTQLRIVFILRIDSNVMNFDVIPFR